MKRWAFCLPAGLLLAAVAPVLPAAATTHTTIELVSGPGAVGTLDPNTDMSLDLGGTWQDAVVIAPHPLYSTLPGTAWISDATSGQNRQGATTLFRRTFDLAAGTQDASLEVCLHADNVAVLFLNGVQFGVQPNAGSLSTFQDPAECFTAPAGTLTEGTNELRFSVRDLGLVMGLDYRATLTYVERVNQPPVLVQPAGVVVDAVGPGGASVGFDNPAVTDDGAGPSTVVCDPPSGSVFAIGSTPVTCIATDDEGLPSVPVSFTVTVRGATDQLGDLLAAATGVGPGKSLPAKVRAAIGAFEAGDVEATCGSLRAFVHEVRAQSGKSIPASVAGVLTGDATRIIAVLACR